MALLRTHLQTYRIPIAVLIVICLLILLPAQFFNTVIAISPLVIGFVVMTIAIDYEWVHDEDLALRYGIYGALAFSICVLVINAILALIGWHVFTFGGLLTSIIGFLLVVMLPCLIGAIVAIFMTPITQSLINGAIGAGVLLGIAIISAWLNIPLYAPVALIVPMVSAGYTTRHLMQTETDAPTELILREGLITGITSGLMNSLFAVILIRFLLCLGVSSCTDHFTIFGTIITDLIFGLMIGLHIILAWLGAIIGWLITRS